MTSACTMWMLWVLESIHSTDADVIVRPTMASPGTASTTAGPIPGYSEDNVCNDEENGPQACAHLSDEISMMQGAMRVSPSSNLEDLVQKAVQEAVNAQNDKIASWQKELKQENDELKTELQHKDNKITNLEKTVFGVEQRLNLQEEKHEE
mmetsp:Transcript_160990/g.296836  ORF Transcript_160990/g.296836 Transcript_160990/m.296836 type:complete len:151 (-) Transcript_160990:4-456(-)